MKPYLATALVIAATSPGAAAQGLPPATPQEIAMRVADRIVLETRFEFGRGLPHGEQEGFYYVDFRKGPDSQTGVYNARTTLAVDSSVAAADLAALNLGISHSAGTFEIQVDGRVAYAGSGDRSGYQHLDYALVRPRISIPLEVGAGIHEVWLRFQPTGADARIRLGLIRSDNELAFEGAEFLLPDGLEAGDASRFLVRGSSRDEWFVPRVQLVRRLPHRLAFSDWRYFTGTFLDAMLAISDTFDQLDYVYFIEAHMDYFIQQRPIIERERELEGLIESPFGHYFRFSLLDDMGMQTVPFAERLRRKPGGNRARIDREIVDRSLDHVMYRSSRLEDGTWARLNPDSLTVWADDLFMGSILLSRMAGIDNQPAYLDEAAHQVMMMDRYLRDPESNLYWHGYFARTGEHSSSKWGRANGWTMMAKTELLIQMPEDHPRRDEVLEAFAKHAAALLAVQSEDGRWHQVLDNPDTYLETSCTAMFTRAFAEGVARGWLPDDGFREAAERGWEAIARQVRPDGRVEGIVRGTPIFYSDQEYQDHPTRLNDPRGLGAVLYAAAAMEKLNR